MTQQEIAQKILDRFAETNSRANHTIDQSWLIHNFISKLNPKEKDLVKPAIEDLVNNGFVTTEDRHGPCIVLTEKGYNAIYVVNEQDTIDKISTAILNRFREQNSKVNHIVNQDWLKFSSMDKLNPKEVELVSPAIESLVTKGFITKKEDRHGFCLVLTEKGFNAIY